MGKVRFGLPEILVLVVAALVVVISLLTQFDISGIERGNENYELIAMSNIFFFMLFLLHWTYIRIGRDFMRYAPNKLALFPLSRFEAFKLEYWNLLGKVPVLLLASSAFYAIIIFYFDAVDASLVIKMAIIFLLQFHALNWIFLFIRNLIQPNISHVLTLCIFLNILNMMANTFDQPLLYLNPITGWLMIPVMFEFDNFEYITFIAAALSVFYVLYLVTKRYVKWMV